MLLTVAATTARSYDTDDIPHVQRTDRTRFTSNPDGILSDEAVAYIDSICASLRDRGIAEVAVVAVDDVAGDDVFDFAYELFSTWGVGDSERDNGLGILFVGDRREIRFVTGYGLEGALPDAICKRIQQRYMLPWFRAGDYSRGMAAGVDAVARRLEGSELPLADGAAHGFDHPWLVLLIFAGLIVVLAGAPLAAYRRSRRCPRCGRMSLRLQSAVRTAQQGVSEYTFVCPHCGQTVRRRRRDHHNDGFGAGPGAGGGVFMGGGFGGFGGGSSGGGFGGGGFGGGGAGSRW